MLLRRITDHVKAQNWTAVCLDFIIVVIGVFIGIQVSNWNDARAERDRVKSYAQRLIHDMHTDAQVMAEFLAYYTQTKEHGERAIARLGKDVEAYDAPLLIDLYQASQIRRFSPQRATYDEMLASGVVKALPDPDLRTRIANYYQNMGNLEQALLEQADYREHLREYLPHAIQTRVRAECGDQFAMTANNVMAVTLPERCPMRFNTAEIDEAARSLNEYDDLKRELTRHLSVTETKIEAMSGFEVQSLIDDLSEITR